MTSIRENSGTVQVTIRSIGTLHPGALGRVESGLYFDLGGKLRNPHHDPRMRYRTGLEHEVRDHVMSTPGAPAQVAQIAESAKAALTYANPRHRLVHVTVACRGGRHRSVAVAEQVAEALRAEDIGVEVDHDHVHLPVVENQ